MDAFTAFPSGLPSTLYTHLKASLTPLASRNMISSRSSRECNYKGDASWTTNFCAMGVRMAESHVGGSQAIFEARAMNPLSSADGLSP